MFGPTPTSDPNPIVVGVLVPNVLPFLGDSAGFGVPV